MRRIIYSGVLALAIGVFCLAAQQKGGKNAPAQAAPPQSSPEITAVRAIITAQRTNDLDGTIKAAENFVTTYPNSQYKELALTMEGSAYRAKGDPIKAQVVYEMVAAMDPKSIPANLTLGELITLQTGEKDFDRDQKLANAEKYLKATLDLLNGPKPNAAIGDEEWAKDKRDYAAEVHDDFGMIALIRKNNDAAIQEFQTASSMTPEPAYSARLAHALQLAGKNAEAIALCDKLLADPALKPAVKQLVDNVRSIAVAASKPPAK